MHDACKQAAKSYARTLLSSGLATLAATALHHVYGGLIHGTPWRIHGAVIALALALPLSGAFWGYHRHPGSPVGRAFGWLLLVLALAFPVIAVGLFEGAYNHVLKNLLSLAHVPRALLLQLFPPPRYELPNDVWFELSGVAQVVPAFATTLAAWRLWLELRRIGPRHAVTPGDRVDAMELVSTTGELVRIPQEAMFVHLQFRRFAGCPVCNLHLMRFARRNGELAAHGIREVVLFHSSAVELRPHVQNLPFSVVADPDKLQYAAFGVEASVWSLLSPAAWLPIAHAVLRSAFAILKRKERAPGLRPAGGRLGLPADFLIAPNGVVLACSYGEHVEDHWEVDDVLRLTRAATEVGSSTRVPGPSGALLQQETWEP